jgi:hypothetical protein
MTNSPALADLDELLVDRVDDVLVAARRAAQPPLSNIRPRLAAELHAAGESVNSLRGAPRTVHDDQAAAHLRHAAREAAALAEECELARLRPVTDPAAPKAVGERERLAAQAADEERAREEAQHRVSRFRDQVDDGRVDLDALVARHGAALGLTWPQASSGLAGAVDGADAASRLLGALWAPDAGPVGASVAMLARVTAQAREVLDAAAAARRRLDYVPISLGASR